jgi:hemerythrin-like domain-containing protein
MDEHKTILQALAVLEAMGQKAGSGEMPPRQDLQDVLRFLKTFADDHHQAREEAILFPVLMRACDCEQTPSIKHMVFEHNQERSLINGLEDSLQTSNAPDCAYYAKRLGDILRVHIYKEDHILFELVEKKLSAKEDAEVVAGFEQMALSPAANDALRSRLRELERKYLGKAA